MSDDEPKPGPRKLAFRRSGSINKLPAEAAKRQGAITRLALELIGAKDAAIAYLNEHSASLGGRPLDLATASDAGLAAVERDLRTLSGAVAGTWSDFKSDGIA